MPSKSAILNSALHLIGEPEDATPLTTTNKEWVKRVRDRYDEKVRLAFEKHPWNFCTDVEVLTATEPTPAGWDYGFNKPAGCWRIVKVTNGEHNMRPDGASIMYEDRAGRICSNEATTCLKYISSEWLTLEGSWSQHFADLVAALLAHAVVPVSDSNENTMDRLDKWQAKMLRVAKNWDAQQQPAWPTGPSRWQVSRFSGMRGGRENDT
jgi:hypothetical protein